MNIEDVGAFSCGRRSWLGRQAENLLGMFLLDRDSKPAKPNRTGENI